MREAAEASSLLHGQGMGRTIDGSEPKPATGSRERLMVSTAKRSLAGAQVSSEPACTCCRLSVRSLYSAGTFCMMEVDPTIPEALHLLQLLAAAVQHHNAQ